MMSQPLFRDGAWRFYSIHKRCDHLYMLNFITFFKPKMPGSDRLPYSRHLPFKINNFTRSSINSNPYKGVPLHSLVFLYMCTARQSLGPRYP
ncbi:hypothetical protein midi_00949 [Candidatus Midichloria mitochondrii IricVA]|uniref:Uncharacterized protein n=1 Tax=Midichloria mitochondrii (strain IricVA) TaxID=696127 RepID=F7XX31_MIDMI|nr:hypothetical protein midi_00949 [Candidatus Midichloria mitochondrii IricVA]